MSKQCPQCGTQAPDYHQFCAKCDMDFPLAYENAVVEAPYSADAEAKPDHVGELDTQTSAADPCHFSGYNPLVQHVTDRRGAHHELAAPIPEFEMPACPNCGKHVWSDMTVCCYCGVDLDIVGWASSTVPAAVGAMDVSTTDPSLEPHDLATAGTAIEKVAPPLGVYFNADKIYFENEMGFLHLLVHNLCPHVVERVHITIRGSTLQQRLEGASQGALTPRQTISLIVPEMLPVRCGEDALEMLIAGNLSGEDDFHLMGTVPIRILRRSQNVPNISIDIAAPEIGDQTISLPKLHDTEHDEAARATEKWTTVALFFDRRTEQMQERFFPKSHRPANESKLDPGIIRGMQMLSPETAPVAALSTQDGRVYFIVPGNTLLMGRDAQRNHMPLVLNPEREYRSLNLTISRLHSRLFVKDKRVYIRDVSKTGICIGNKPIAKNQDVMLPSGEILTFENRLELEIHIVTHDEDVLAVLVKRLNNTSRHTYILAHGPLPVGDGLDLSLREGSKPDIFGCVYCRQPIDGWHFLTYGAFPEKGKDMKLGKFHELAFGSQKLWFSQIE